MPDFERVLRRMELDIASNPLKKAEIAARHRGEDRARRQIVWIAVAIAIVATVARIFLHL